MKPDGPRGPRFPKPAGATTASALHNSAAEQVPEHQFLQPGAEQRHGMLAIPVAATMDRPQNGVAKNGLLHGARAVRQQCAN